MQQQLILPEGGLASFLTSNLDEIDDSRLLFGKQSGINSHRGIAEKMAGFGRNGDTEMIHAEKGEIIIHPKLLEENPRLAQEMMDAFSSSGVNLDRYTVGGEANSINPRTGQAEFFFKKLVKSVKKLVKTVAPIVVPLALNFFTGGAYGALSMVAQGAISGGITSLIQGGNIKDALKGAAMGGVMGGISAGAQGFMKAEGGLGQKFGAGIKSFKGSVMDTFKAPNSGFILGESAKKFSTPSGVDGNLVDFSTKSSDYTIKPTGANLQKVGNSIDVNMGTGAEVQTGFRKYIPDSVEKLFYDSPKDASSFLPEGVSFTDASDLAQKEAVALAAKSGGIKLVPTIGAGLALAAPMGLYDPIPEKELEDPYDGTSPSEDRLAENPERYRVGVPDVPYLRATMDDIAVPSQEQLLYEQYLNQPQYAAAGGEMKDFPRRNGYIAGRGTETSDSIPAMLSDGEFVMNARAVRGAGNGSREKGVRKMYDIMRAFEGGAVA
jgi:hypothetical protein